MVKKLRYFCTLLLMMVASVTWAGEETVTFSSLDLENGYAMIPGDNDQAWGDNFKVQFFQGTNSNPPKYYSTGESVRCYGGNYFTIKSAYTLTKIELTFGSSDGSNAITTDKDTYSDGTWEGSESEVTFTIGGTKGNRRIASIKVTWDEGGSTLQEAGLSFGNTTSFEVDQNSDGTFPAFQAPTLTKATDAEVTYSSSKESVATVNAETGAVTIVGCGETTITAQAEATDAYMAGHASYTLKVNMYIDPTAGTKENPYTVEQAIAAIDAAKPDNVSGVYAKGIVTKIVTAYNSQFGNITYDISSDGTADAAQLRAYRGVGLNGEDFTSENDIMPGDEVTIYGDLTLYGSTYEFAQGNYLVAFNRPGEVVDVATVNSLTPTSLTVGDEGKFVADVTVAKGVADDDYEVTFSADNDDVLTVLSDGTYQAVAKGTVTVTVHVEAVDAEHFNNVDKEFTVVVKNAAAPAATGDYKLVTSTADIEDGQYLIVYEDTEIAMDGALGTGIDKVQNYIGVAKSGDFIVATDAANAASFNITAVDGGFAIATQDNTVIGNTTSGANALKTGDNLVNTIEITEEGDADIVSSDTHLRYNASSGQDRFRYYKSSSYTSQKAVYLYKRVNETAPAVTFDVNVTAAGYATLYYGASNLIVPEGVKASTYTVTEGQLQESKVYTANKVIPAGTGVVLKAAEGTYTFTATSEVAEGDDANMLKGSDGDYRDKTEGFMYYILSCDQQGQNPGFYFQNEGGTQVDNAPHKAYLAVPAPVAGEAKFFTFGGETGINAVEAGKTNGVVYNLQGQRVENAQKGIFIMNGKKVVR